jgi:hypothetical protein
MGKGKGKDDGKGKGKDGYVPFSVRRPSRRSPRTPAAAADGSRAPPAAVAEGRRRAGSTGRLDLCGHSTSR